MKTHGCIVKWYREPPQELLKQLSQRFTGKSKNDLSITCKHHQDAFLTLPHLEESLAASLIVTKRNGMDLNCFDKKKLLRKSYRQIMNDGRSSNISHQKLHKIFDDNLVDYCSGNVELYIYFAINWSNVPFDKFEIRNCNFCKVKKTHIKRLICSHLKVDNCATIFGTSISGYTTEDALANFEGAVKLMCGIANVLLLPTTFIHLLNSEQPLGCVLVWKKIAIAKQIDSLENLEVQRFIRYDEDDFYIRRSKDNNDVIEECSNIVNLLNKNILRDALEELLCAYGHAFHISDKWSLLKQMWTVLECTIKSDQKISYDALVELAVSNINDDDQRSLYKSLMKVACMLRNNGSHSIRNSEDVLASIFLLNQVFLSHFMFLLKNPLNFKTIKDYYRYLKMPLERSDIEKLQSYLHHKMLRFYT